LPFFIHILGTIRPPRSTPAPPAAAWQRRKLESRQADGGLP